MFDRQVQIRNDISFALVLTEFWISNSSFDTSGATLPIHLSSHREGVERMSFHSVKCVVHCIVLNALIVKLLYSHFLSSDP